MTSDQTVAVPGVQVDLGRAVWRKSTKSGPWSDNCVEVALVDGVIALRDSKDRTGPALVFSRTEWLAFIDGTKAGDLAA